MYFNLYCYILGFKYHKVSGIESSIAFWKTIVKGMEIKPQQIILVLVIGI